MDFTETLAILVGGAGLCVMLALIVTAACQAVCADFKDSPMLKWVWLLIILATPGIGAAVWVMLRMSGSPWAGARSAVAVADRSEQA